MWVSNQISPKFKIGQRLVDSSSNGNISYIIKLIYFHKRNNKIYYEIEMHWNYLYKLNMKSCGIKIPSDGTTYKISERNLCNLILN